MNDQATLLGYLAFSCLKKIIKQVQLVSVCPNFPYCSLTVELPFELQDSMITVLKESLRGIIKQKAYQVFEMVPHVAQNYAESKQLKLELSGDDSVISVIETGDLIFQMHHSVENNELPSPFQFDLFEVKTGKNSVCLIFGMGDDVKVLKKAAAKASELNVKDFLLNSGVLSSRNAFKRRGIDLLNYYKSIVERSLYPLGFSVESKNSTFDYYIITASDGQEIHDPLILPFMKLKSHKLHFSLSLDMKKLASVLNSLIKVFQELKLVTKITFNGKFTENELFILSKNIEGFEVVKSMQKGVTIALLDKFERYVDSCFFSLMRRNVDCEVDVVKIILTNLLVHGRLYPDNMVKPLQVAVCGDLVLYPELVETLFELRLKGASAFAFEKKDVISDKQALDYQIDNLIYYCESAGVVRKRSFN